MTSFHEVRFPDAIAYGATGGPEYLTDIVILQSGFEQRNQSWDSARARYDVSTGIKNPTQAAEVISFFRARKGRAYGFRFKDWSDYRVIGQLIGAGNGTQTAFQLTKTYTSGGENETRPLKKPVSGTVKIYKDSILQSSAVTVDHTTGMVTFTTAPTTGVLITADCEFDVPVRFDTDRLAIRIQSHELFVWDQIPLIEIRL
jgi:uncharacterized protein (TIGR02217 family)